MAPSPQCAALTAAMTKKGLTYADVAAKINKPEQHVIDICTGASTPTSSEFNALATALGITDAPPADRAHATV